MTDRARYSRRLAALGLVPLSAGAFGGAMAWAGSHDPLAPALPTTSPTPAAASTTDPEVTAALADVADAKARILALQATLDQRAAAAAAAGLAAGTVQATPGPVVAKPPAAPAPARAAAPAARAAAPPVQTTTRASR
jgi:hypothetical protein